jgi:hypothetical protein
MSDLRAVREWITVSLQRTFRAAQDVAQARLMHTELVFDSGWYIGVDGVKIDGSEKWSGVN